MGKRYETVQAIYDTLPNCDSGREGSFAISTAGRSDKEIDIIKERMSRQMSKRGHFVLWSSKKGGLAGTLM